MAEGPILRYPTHKSWDNSELSAPAYSEVTPLQKKINKKKIKVLESLSTLGLFTNSWSIRFFLKKKF